MRLSPCVLVQPDGWARGEREGYGEPCDVTSLSLSLGFLLYPYVRRGDAWERPRCGHKSSYDTANLERRDLDDAARAGVAEGVVRAPVSR